MLTYVSNIHSCPKNDYYVGVKFSLIIISIFNKLTVTGKKTDLELIFIKTYPIIKKKIIRFPPV